MTEVFLGQIMMTGFQFAPRGFALCNGQLLAISQNTALFSLLGTQYGGNGQTNFALPNLQGRVPVGFGSSVDGAWQPPVLSIGQTGGVESVTLLVTQLPTHNHLLQGTSVAGTSRNPTDKLYGTNTASLYASSGSALVALNADTLAPAGGTQPHQNMQPYKVINFCIALQGIFPSRN
ncbi:phage tail protein [Montanilutibacter psychrotolerans]|uniref:Microcystin-dependent protein n=1 Tax=Montanilutibacter psychrotolerans TaxID=1327343 RepID=A0A3M8T081_9GAMM|nr:tail fiber protein [Lysobacter psychrotolerans]RNF86433.1 microcystin-dependent protein [Lysobacter psychrotolerans]